MVGLNDLLAQILQPYFFYSIVFVSIAVICVKVFLKFNPQISKAQQSILWLVPLVVPVFVFMLYYPQTAIQYSLIKHVQVPAAPSDYSLFLRSQGSLLSLTGYLCIGGAVAALGYFVVSFVFGQKIAMKAFHVVKMYPEEYVSVQAKVKEVSRKIGVPTPKVGLVDDLRPNAFTLGYGRNTMIVFSLGILKMLTLEELTAVVSHELAHVRARDYMFRSLSYTLNILSFFNPLAYFATAEAQKKRELQADEKGACLLSQPKLLANVLTKIDSVLQNHPRDSFLNRFSSSLFLVSPLARRPDVFAGHPEVIRRVENIDVFTSKSSAQKPRHRIVAILLVAILVSVAVLSGYAAVEVQASFQNTKVYTTLSNGDLTGNQTVIINANSENSTLSPPHYLLFNATGSGLQLHGNPPDGNLLVRNGSETLFLSNSSTANPSQQRYLIEAPIQ